MPCFGALEAGGTKMVCAVGSEDGKIPTPVPTVIYTLVDTSRVQPHTASPRAAAFTSVSKPIERRWGRKAQELADCDAVWELESYYIAQAVCDRGAERSETLLKKVAQALF